MDKEHASWQAPPMPPKVWFIDKDAVLSKLAFVPEDHVYKITGINKIPRLLHLIWVGHKKQPEYLKTHIETWAKLMPNWTIRLWTNEDINVADFPEKIIKIINSANKGAQKADIMRYFIIEKYGGVYIDTDMIPNKSLEPLINFTDTDMVLCHDCEITWEFIINAFFASVPHHPVLKMACEMCYTVELNTHDIEEKTGPLMLGYALAKTSITDKVYILPSKMFYWNKDYNERFAHHLFAKSWKV